LRIQSKSPYCEQMVPLVEIVPLLYGPSVARDQADQGLALAAGEFGLFTIAGPSDVVPTWGAVREAMLKVFALPADWQRLLWRNFYEPSQTNVYRGWSPRASRLGVDTFDMGPTIVPDRAVQIHDDDPLDDDPLLGETPLPHVDELPGWHEAVATYYVAMERIGVAIMRSIARTLGVGEHYFDDSFCNGISTLRLMRYELPSVDPDEEAAVSPGIPRLGEHVDSGFVTLLCQHGVAGLEAKLRDGQWIEVPPLDGHIVVNFGGLLERWTEGRIRATPHRVVSHGNIRHSIPFFYEPRADAIIEPLPIAGAKSFDPFAYGDHLWAAMSKFPNFAGVADLRVPRGVHRPTP
jgi:isopenicillin N synthase-like dioxygenase